MERDAIVERHLGLAESLARRYQHTSEPFDDLVQVARVGLIKAAERWDPDRGTTFSTFAVPTITGELRRYFRDSTWTIKPPRRLQELYLSVKRTREVLAQELGREPTAADVAARLGRTPEDVIDALQAAGAHSPLSLDAPLQGDGGDDGSFTRIDVLPDGGRELARTEDHLALRQLGSVLDDREAEVIRLRYEEDLLQREIADRVGCSQMHVSRILTEALAHLRSAAAAGAGFD